MIFYSKGNYGFISDSTLSIDNKGGMIVNTDDDVTYTTNGSNYTIETETGEIHLGNGSSEEPLVLGDTLVELLNELCTELQAMTHPTPAAITLCVPNVTVLSIVSVTPLCRVSFSTWFNIGFLVYV